MPSSPTPPASSRLVTKGIVLVEPYEALAIAISSALKRFAPEHQVRVARSLAEAEIAAAEMHAELFIIDLDPAPAGDVEFLVKLKSRRPDARVLVIAPGTSAELRAERGHASAVQFIEKPFDLGEFGAAVQALLGPWTTPPSDDARGTLRDLHVIDIVQLKCLALSSCVLSLETSTGQTGEIHFQHGQITHAATGKLTGVPAFEIIVRGSAATFREHEAPEHAPRTIADHPWPELLLQALRKAPRAKPAAPQPPAAPAPPPTATRKTILAIDDTEMLLIFAADVLGTAHADFHVATALTGGEGLRLAATLNPDLILLDYSLTDMTGADVCRELLQSERTSRIPVLMMSGHLPELANAAATFANVVATLPKPFLSRALIEHVEKLLAAGPLRETPAPSPAPPAPSASAAPAPSPSPKTDAPPISRPTPPSNTGTANGHGNGNGHGPTKASGSASGAIVFSAHAAVATMAPRSRPPVASVAAGREESSAKDVVVTFPLAIVAMQLRPDFQMGAMQLKPLDAPVSVRVAEANQRNDLLVETSFRTGQVQLTPDGQIDTMLLFPTAPAPRIPPGGNTFAVQTVRARGPAPERVVELTAAAQNEAMRVHLAARFEFLTVELSPTFEVVAVILRARDRAVLIGPGAASTTAPFQIERAQADETGRLRELFVRSSR